MATFNMFSLAQEGFNNLNKIIKNGTDGLVDVLTPSKKDLIRQSKGVLGGGGPAPALVEVVPKIPDIIPNSIKDPFSKAGKYIKYAAIGGAALLAYSILKK